MNKFARLLCYISLVSIATLILLPVFFSIASATTDTAATNSKVQATTMSDNEIQALTTLQLADKYKHLRHQKSHWDQDSEDDDENDKKAEAQNPGELNEQVDGFNGEKHQVMKELGTRLGKSGTKWEQVLDAMGEPDEITRSLDNPFQTP